MKRILLAVISFCFINSYAQVGVGTTSPIVTLDVIGNPTVDTVPDGLKVPQITLMQLNAKHNKNVYTAAHQGTIIYVTNVTNTGTTIPATASVNSRNYYIFDGTIWNPIPKSGNVIFNASTGTGTGGISAYTITANGFNTIPLLNIPVVNKGGGEWDSSNYEYKVPISGTYLLKSSIRVVDGSGAGVNLFQAVHTANADTPQGIWQTVTHPTVGSGTKRWTMLYTRVAYFDAGVKLRLVTYADGQNLSISDAALDIVLLGELGK